MSAIDPQAEFMSDLDDWYAQLFALRISTAPPVNPRVKEKFLLSYKIVATKRVIGD